MATRQPSQADAGRKTQAALTVAFAAALAKLWPVVDLSDLKGTLPIYKNGAAALVQHYASAATSLAADRYEQVRAASGVRPPGRTPVVEVPPTPQVEAAVDWATSGLWGPDSLTDPAVVEKVQTNLDGALGKLVLDAGRNQIVDASEADDVMVGWAREARPDACWFCAMLATRGAVYSTPLAAGKARPKQGQMPTGLDAEGKEFVNRYHDHCHCVVVPVFNVYEKQAHVRAWTDLWNTSTADVTGMKAKQDAFRAALAAQRAA